MDNTMTHKALDAFCFYNKCNLDFKTLVDLFEYHENCVRWHPDREWPNIQTLRNIAGNTETPAARVFKGLYDSLKKDDVLTLKFVASDGPCLYELLT